MPALLLIYLSSWVFFFNFLLSLLFSLIKNTSFLAPLHPLAIPYLLLCLPFSPTNVALFPRPEMNGVFAEERGRLLLGQRAGVSQQPADLSTAAVFMLCLVPQLSLPVVLPVFLFPNSSSNSPSSPSFQFNFSSQPSHSFRT